jgi:hypothetical protein
MILETMHRPRRFFDVNSKEDIARARDFFRDHRWNDGCPFILEYPYMTIPDMIKDKMIHHALGLEYDRRHHWNFKKESQYEILQRID